MTLMTISASDLTTYLHRTPQTQPPHSHYNKSTMAKRKNKSKRGGGGSNAKKPEDAGAAGKKETEGIGPLDRPAIRATPMWDDVAHTTHSKSK